ncbi:MAG: hypothetical protein FJ290_14095 [Planctomycetes bacterium]|nr:hypothetical protein [Planctomycetota bacterium]
MRILADENLHAGVVQDLRREGHQVLFAPDVGLGATEDRSILGYAEEHGLVVVSGDKDFGGLIEFGPLWGRGKVVLLRYRLLRIGPIVADILSVLKRERSLLESPGPVVLVLSEGRYRVHRPS